MHALMWPSGQQHDLKVDKKLDPEYSQTYNIITSRPEHPKYTITGVMEIARFCMNHVGIILCKIHDVVLNTSEQVSHVNQTLYLSPAFR